MSDMDPFNAEAVRIALRRMFKAGRFFDICAVRTCLTALQVEPPEEELDALRPLHCVSWSEMTPEMAREVQARTLALFSHPAIDLSDLEPKALGEASSLFRRLLGKGSADA